MADIPAAKFSANVNHGSVGGRPYLEYAGGGPGAGTKGSTCGWATPGGILAFGFGFWFPGAAPCPGGVLALGGIASIIP